MELNVSNILVISNPSDNNIDSKMTCALSPTLNLPQSVNQSIQMLWQWLICSIVHWYSWVSISI